MAHNSTMFGQLLKLVGRHEFEKLASEHQTGRKAHKVTRWSQFVAMGMVHVELMGIATIPKHFKTFHRYQYWHKAHHNAEGTETE